MADQLIETRTGVAKQLTGIFSRLNRTQLATIAGVALMAIGGILFLVLSSSKPQMSVLFSELQEKDVALITEKLKERKIEYELTDKGKTILVPTPSLYDTRIALASEGLPQNSVVGYEIFDKTNLGMSDFVQKLNYRRALEGELARTIGTLDEVEKARVHIVIPEKALFDKDQKKPTASVVLQLKSNRKISQGNIEGIQHLVSSSVEGMESGVVNVLDHKGKVLSEPLKDKNSLAGLSSTQYEQQQKVDEYLTSQVQSLLDGVIGPGNSVVRINSELDFTRVEKTIEDFDPERQVVRSEQTIANKSRSADSLNFPAVNQATEGSNIATNYEISKTVQKIVGSVGSMKRLSVAAFINGTTKIAPDASGKPAPQYTPRSAEEIEQFKQIIRNAVGYDPSRNDQISVVNVPFDTNLPDEDLLQKKFLGLPISQQEFIEKMLLIVVMLLAVFMIRRLIASPQVRRRIEQVLAPSDLDKQRIELARSTAERQQNLLKNLTEETLMAALPEAKSIDELSVRARAKLDLPEAVVTEDALLKQEMKERVVSYITEKPDEAAKLVKALLRQNQYSQAAPEPKRKK